MLALLVVVLLVAILSKIAVLVDVCDSGFTDGGS